MSANILINVIIVIILVSIQYTLNLILREIRDMKKLLIRVNNKTAMDLRGENDFGRKD